MTRTTLLALSALLLAPLLAPSAHAQTPVVRINAGGPTVAPPSGPPFTADVPYQPGVSPAGYVLGAPANDDPIGGFLNPHAGVQRTAREGWRAWRVEVPPGDYVLRLHLNELDDHVHGPGLRVFDLTAEGAPLLAGIDIAASQGLRYAEIHVAAVTVSDGTLDIEVPAGSDPALLAALEVWTAPPAPSAPGPVVGLLRKPGFERAILYWQPPGDPTVASSWLGVPGPDGVPEPALIKVAVWGFDSV